MMAIVARVRSVWNATRDLAGQAPGGNEGDAEGDGDGADASGNLFQCAACGAVFIADEKETCANCDEPVDEVPKTFSCEAGDEPAAE